MMNINREIAEKLFNWDYDTGEPIPDYSGEIEFAWLVVEKMRELGFEFGLSNYNHVNDWIASFRGFIVEDEKTAPLTICKAALQAIEDTADIPFFKEVRGTLRAD